MIKVYGSAITIIQNGKKIVRTFTKITEFTIIEFNDISFFNEWTGESEEYFLSAVNKIEIQFLGNKVFEFVYDN